MKPGTIAMGIGNAVVLWIESAALGAVGFQFSGIP